MTKKDKLKCIIRNMLETNNLLAHFDKEVYISNRANEILKICKPRKLSGEKIRQILFKEGNRMPEYKIITLDLINSYILRSKDIWEDE